MTTKTKYTEEDPKLNLMMNRRNLSKGRRKTYDIVFNEIYALFEKTPSEIVTLGKREEKTFLNEESGTLDIIELEDRAVTEYQFKYYAHLKESNCGTKTIKLKLDCFRALLGEYDIQKPKPIMLDIKTDRVRDEDIVSWQEIETAMSFCKGIRDKAILSFFVTTGLRSSDVRRFTIADLVKACDIYFEENEEKNLENLLNKNPDDIIPCWELMPKKTDKKSQLCVTFNTPEASNYLWQYLTNRIEKKMKKGEDGTLDPSEALFSTNRNTHFSENSMRKIFQRLNDNLGGEKDKNGKFGRLRSHAIRKLFSTTVRRNLTQIVVNSDKTSEVDIVSILTGHVPPNESNSKVYEAVESDSHDSYLRKVYTALVPYLSIQNIEVKDVKTQQYKDLEEQNMALKKQLEAQAVAMQREMDEQKEQYEKKLRHFESINLALSEKVTDIESQVDNWTHMNELRFIQEYIADNELVKKHNLSGKVLELYKQDIKNGEASTDNSYIDTLITRAYNHKLMDGSISGVTQPSPEVYNDERMKEIRAETDEIYYHLVSNTDIKLSEAQEEKLKQAISEYEDKIWLEKGKVDPSHVEKLIFDIILNG